MNQNINKINTRPGMVKNRFFEKIQKGPEVDNKGCYGVAITFHFSNNINKIQCFQISII